MSKILYIVRHGKSSWATAGMNDDQRPLKETGISRTNKIGEYLKKNNTHVDLIISSHAVRAYETALIIASHLNYPLNHIQSSRDIYFGNMDKVLEIIFEVDDNLNNIMIFGHNPTFTDLANYFMSKSIEYLPTTGIVAIRFETEKWNEIVSCQRSTKFFITPKLINIRNGKK